MVRPMAISPGPVVVFCFVSPCYLYSLLGCLWYDAFMKEFVDTPITDLLQQWRMGDDGAMDRIAPLIYRELRARAGFYIHRERANHTLSSTELVHEAYVRMVGERDRSFNNRLHFFALASKIMRDVLITYARNRSSQKRGGHCVVFAPECLEQFGDHAAPRLVEDLAEAVEAFSQIDARKAWIVEMHYFAGLGVEEIARVLSLGSATVKRDLHFSRSWLRKFLEENGS